MRSTASSSWRRTRARSGYRGLRGRGRHSRRSDSGEELFFLTPDPRITFFAIALVRFSSNSSCTQRSRPTQLTWPIFDHTCWRFELAWGNFDEITDRRPSTVGASGSVNVEFLGSRVSEEIPGRVRRQVLEGGNLVGLALGLGYRRSASALDRIQMTRKYQSMHCKSCNLDDAMVLLHLFL